MPRPPRDLPVQHVGEYRCGVAIQWVAVAGTATNMFSEMDMGFWLGQTEAKLRELS